MNKPKIALLIDLSSLKVSCEGFKKLLAEIEDKYEVAFVKFYSYVAKRNRDFNEFIAAKGYDAVTPVASKRRNKMDSRQVIDGTKISLNSTVNAVGLAFGEGDILPIVTELKQTGKDVVEIAVEQCAYGEAFNSFIPVDISYLRDGYTAPTKKREKKAPKPVAEKPAATTAAPAAQQKPKGANPYVGEVNRIFQGRSILEKYKK